MSTLEERREARRRRRQEDENDMNGVKSPTIYSEDLEDMLVKKRLEREQKFSEIVAGVTQFNGEDELERRRRERREARIRSGEIEAIPAEEENSVTSRRSRRKQQEEDSYEDTSSSRSRRRRGYNEEDSTPVSAPEPVAQEDTSAEDTRRHQEEEERRRLEKERRRQEEEEEEAQRQAEAEKEHRRQEEEARRRRQEEERKRAEEDRRRKNDIQQFENVGKLSNGNAACDTTSPSLEVHRLSPEKFKIWSEGNDGKGESGKQISADRGQETKAKVKEKLEKFEQIKNEPVEVMRTVEQPVLQGQLRERLQKFERDVEEWIGEMEGSSHKTPFRRSSTSATENKPTPSRRKLQSRLQQFENQSKTLTTSQQFSGTSFNEAKSLDQRNNKLGRWSISETHINVNGPKRGVSRNSVLDRWKFAGNAQKQSNPTSPSKQVPDETLDLVRLSGNTEFKASRFLEKVRRTSSEISPGPETPTSDKNNFFNGERRFSQSSDATSDYSETGSVNHSSQDLGSKIRNTRWSQQSPSQQTVPDLWRRSSPAASHSTTSSYDNEEEERLEQERQEREHQETEESARMAAETEKKKKKGKRKGLGGLSPEKKKILKDSESSDEDVFDDAYEFSEKELAEKEQILSHRIQPLPEDFDRMTSDSLKKLCKALHAKVAQLEEEVYDWEFKIRRQETEINELTLKVNDSRGKFVKPVLRKVNKTESKFEKLKKEKEKSDFRSTLKSHKDEEDEAREADAE